MRKIFVLEDDDDIRDILEMILTSENYMVETFSSVSDFLQRDVSKNPDLFLFDVRLPDGSGIDVLKKIRENDDNVEVPAIIMSAHADVDHLEGVCEPENFISKPFDIDNLLLKVKQVINK